MGMPLSANDSKRMILFLLGGALAAVIAACALAQFFLNHHQPKRFPLAHRVGRDSFL